MLSNFVILNIFLIPFPIFGQAQSFSIIEDGSIRKIIEEESKAVGHDFIEPEEHDEYTQKVVTGTHEFLFIQKPLPYGIAEIICRIGYHGHLAFVKEEIIADFLAEALSETDMLFYTLWIGGRRQTHVSKWKWMKYNHSEEISQDVVQKFVSTPGIMAFDRLCLGFGRKNHDRPQFRPLSCSSHRNMLCQRSTIKDENSSHRDWIKIDNRLFKIFTEEVTWDSALIKCMDYDADASLAVLINYKQCQRLGRYLLIGRPSFENAWIGAKYIDDRYQFLAESITLDNVANEEGYPPWRNGTVKYKHGCLLLDRHLWNTTKYIETRCNRIKPYICYKPIKDDNKIIWNDVIIGEYGYRLHYNKRPWIDSRDYCADHYKEYHAKLAEITGKPILYHLLYVMGENKTTVQHLWIGGKWDKVIEKWIWDSDKSVIETDSNSILHWITNITYTSNVDKDNTCLNMDRENHIRALHYGASCTHRQSFVCQFTKENLEELQQVENQPEDRLHMD